MGPRLREDDGFKANNIGSVIPTKVGPHAELAIYRATNRSHTAIVGTAWFML
jgi:hypothetical protein